LLLLLLMMMIRYALAAAAAADAKHTCRSHQQCSGMCQLCALRGIHCTPSLACTTLAQCLCKHALAPSFASLTQFTAPAPAAAAATCSATAAATNSAVACASFVVFLGSIPSLHHAMTAPHPSVPSKPLVDYTYLSLVIPPILVGIKFGKQPLLLLVNIHARYTAEGSLIGCRATALTVHVYCRI
jgi:hypothetical protein